MPIRPHAFVAMPFGKKPAADGTEKLRYVCLWNGAEGDGKGGTKHMYDEAKRLTGRVDWIDTRTL